MSQEVHLGETHITSAKVHVFGTDGKHEDHYKVGLEIRCTGRRNSYEDGFPKIYASMFLSERDALDFIRVLREGLSLIEEGRLFAGSYI